MLLAIGNIDINPLIDGMIMMAKDRTMIHELNEELGQESWKHNDGWGVSYLKDGKWTIRKSTIAIYEDPFVEELRKIKTNAMIIHVRKKMGSEKSYENTHPFIIKEKEDEFVFCHNGFVDENILFNSHYKAEGQTDSERIFLSILSELDQSLLKAVTKSLSLFNRYSGTNIIISNKEESVIATKKTHFNRYYEMSFLQHEDSFIIGSEPLVTLLDLSWESLKPGFRLSINHNNLNIKIEEDLTPLSLQILSHAGSLIQTDQSARN